MDSSFFEHPILNSPYARPGRHDSRRDARFIAPTPRITVKVINHLGDEVMKVFRVA